MRNKKHFTCIAVRWFDKTNGNTYHSVRVIRHKDNKILYGEFQYGYDDAYRQTAGVLMLNAGWLPKKYTADNVFSYDRENNYPIIYTVSDGLKRDCINNGIE